MRFSVSREVLLKPLQLVAGVVEKRQTLAALANVLVIMQEGRLSLTGTDLEVEIVGMIDADVDGVDGEITVPAKKFLDICRSLPENSQIDFQCQDQKAVVRSGRSRFTLSTLAASDYPNIQIGQDEFSFSCTQSDIRSVVDKTHFAMGQQDVRFYLNGMLWEIKQGTLRAVATDGHRLALASVPVTSDWEADSKQAIIPRKGIVELARLFSEPDAPVQILLSSNHMRAITRNFVFTSKLIDAKFPDYERVLPRGGNKIVIAERDVLRHAFSRTAILSNDKYRGVRFELAEGLLRITANNLEQEEAEEEVSVDYEGPALEVGFNVNYLIDVMNVIASESIRITLADSNSSALIQQPGDDNALYVVMPMKL